MLLHSSSASLCTQQSPSSTLPSSTNYHKLVASFASSGPKPYGTIPRRRRNRASSTASISPTPSSRSSLSSRNSLELLPAASFSQSTQISPSATSFWASLKAQYLATAHSFSWATAPPFTFTRSRNNNSNNTRRSTDCAREFLPPVALLVANSSPVVTLDATPLILTTSEANSHEDGKLYEYNNMEDGLYPASVAAMDKFKVMRSDNIALKTFTYHETPVVEVKRPAPRTPLLTQRRRPASNNDRVAKASTAATPIPTIAISPPEEEMPLPRHLACRETRSNSDYLRMMASEISMIRARKLIAPLKPRAFLPRRKELFTSAKSSLSISMVMPREEDDHPLNDLLGSSWTSFSSTESYFSAVSSEYATADENFD
ncbi:hypothetical protein FBU30_002392 [Linnemannia zychae]|nr:hypothetical protein FBU30_002392 [Linnemannia zychae]